MSGTWHAIGLCAKQELALAVRSRWTQTFAIVFAALALLVAGSGYVLSGGTGMQDFARTAASLGQIVILLVPLASLVFGVMALAPEPGEAELLFSQPVPRSAILAGRVLGLFTALVAAQAAGFGAAGLVMFAQAGQSGMAGFLGVVLGSVVLTAVFLAIAAAVVAGGAAGVKRARNLAVALVIWFVAVVLFDIAALGAASFLPSGLASRTLMIAAVVNPVDAVRTGTLLGVEGTTAFGAASLAFLRFTGGPLAAAAVLTLSVLVWIVAPLAIGVARLRRADI